ncbi:MAG: DUF2141 domain-containing protein [Pseudomonadota bacterium]
MRKLSLSAFIACAFVSVAPTGVHAQTDIEQADIEQTGSEPTPSVDPALFDFEHVSCIVGKNEIRIVIEEVNRSVGLVVADLYENNQDGFLKRAGRVAQVRFAARAPMTKFCMRAPKPDQYAIAVYHDENANKTFDKNAFGLPAEPFGISNNPRLRFAPPRIEATLFTVDADGANVAIRMRN